MASSLDYPSVFQDLYYKPNQGSPSYGSELPQEFPYDPGATSSLYELGYIPNQQSIIPLIGILLLFSFVTVFVLRSGKFRKFFTYGMMAAITLSFLGPLKLPNIIHFQTTLGIAKLIAFTCLFFAIITDIKNKKSSFIKQKSFVPLGLYLTLSFLSVFWVTNLNFFMADMNIIITGIVFFAASFYFVDTKENLHLLAKLLGYTMLIPALLVLSIFVFPSQGRTLMSGIYPVYENIVFNFDISRDRILSVIDLEFLIPFVCYLFILSRKKVKESILFGIVFAGVLLTNYRYRVLSFSVGVFSYFLLGGKQYLKKLFISSIAILGTIFTLYMFISIFLGRTTIVDRFLLKSYENDVDSLRRRVVMAKQAIDLFSQFPILGVGVGNYKDNVQVFLENYGGRTYEPTYKVLQNVYAYPHNWFLLVLAENGVIGFLVLIWLLFGFSSIDRFLYKKLQNDERLLFLAFSVTSWLYVFANFFTPLHNSLPMVIVFWSCRGIIERIYMNEKRI